MRGNHMFTPRVGNLGKRGGKEEKIREKGETGDNLEYYTSLKEKGGTNKRNKGFGLGPNVHGRRGGRGILGRGIRISLIQKKSTTQLGKGEERDMQPSRKREPTRKGGKRKKPGPVGGVGTHKTWFYGKAKSLPGGGCEFEWEKKFRRLRGG